MKHRWTRFACVALLAVLMAVSAGTLRAAQSLSPTRVQQTFFEAAQAYDQGRFADAARMYTNLLHQGYVSRELFFNLGNACFRNGQAGEAVLQYRRAWHLSPRDPDVLANLGFAQRATGAPSVARSAFGSLLDRLALAEWVVVALVGFWGGSAAAVFVILGGRGRITGARLLMVMALLLIVGICGIANWADRYRNPEVVVVRRNQQALFAPLAGSTPHFALPEGTITRLYERSGSWLRVSLGEQTGWVEGSSCQPVYPWQP